MTCPQEMILEGSVFALLQGFSFSLFYHGTSRISRSLDHIFHMALLNFILGSMLWFAVGYSMVYGQSQKGLIGTMDHALLLDVPDALRSSPGNETDSDSSRGGVSIVIFEMTFAILAPAIVLITWSEKIKPTGAMLFMILWPLFVYYPLAHWIRAADGWLSNTVDVIDVAGGLTLHTTAGTAHLLLTILTKRKFPSCEKVSQVDRYLQKERESKKLAFIFFGSLLTIAGWLSLNAGSLRMVDNVQGLVLLNSHLTACGSAIFWLMVTFLYTGQSSNLDIFYGVLAGLAGSSSYCGHVDPWSSLVIGCFIGLLSHAFYILVKSNVTMCVRENSLDITFVFGIPAILGSIAAGLFSNTHDSNGAVQIKGAFYSNPIQLPYQFLGIVVVISWTSLWSLLLFKFIQTTVGLFISTMDERQHKEFDVCDVHKRNNEERVVRERLMTAAKNGDLQQLQELRRNFAVNFGLKDFYQKTALHYTSENGDYNCTQYLLKQREVDVHAKDRYGATALSEAVRKHREDIIILLLDHGASWSIDGVGEILCSYVALGKIDEVRRLHYLGMDLNSTNFQGETGLHIAACQGDTLMVECLLNMNVHVNKVDCFGHRPLNCAEMHEHEAMTEILIKHGALKVNRKYTQREICDEASKGNLRAIKHMVNNGANVSYQDIEGKTALHASCRSGHLDVVKFLLNQPGVDVNVRDKKENTPLTEAIVHLQNDVAEYLQLHGGKIEERRMMHLICKAVKDHDKRLVKQLLQWFNGSIVIDLDGQSVFHVCVRSGDLEMVRTLIKAGLSFRDLDFFGNTPLELAIQLRCDSSIIKLLAEVEEGKLKAQSSSINVEKLRREVSSKSLIRRRRTRRQTRVEVASGDFTDRRITAQTKPQVNENYKKNVFENEVDGDTIIEEDSLGIPEEVTLADIELMNRQKKLNSFRISDIVTGEPQFV